MFILPFFFDPVHPISASLEKEIAYQTIGWLAFFKSVLVVLLKTRKLCNNNFFFVSIKNWLNQEEEVPNAKSRFKKATSSVEW